MDRARSRACSHFLRQEAELSLRSCVAKSAASKTGGALWTTFLAGWIFETKAASGWVGIGFGFAPGEWRLASRPVTSPRTPATTAISQVRISELTPEERTQGNGRTSARDSKIRIERGQASERSIQA